MTQIEKETVYVQLLDEFMSQCNTKSRRQVAPLSRKNESTAEKEQAGKIELNDWTFEFQYCLS